MIITWPSTTAYSVSLVVERLRLERLDQMVDDGQVMIIDEFTGRILEGRRWSEGLHQAIEAKEGVSIREENQTLATITLQNYFRLYGKLSGMTGTAMTEATEFMKIYEVPTVEIPTHRDMIRADNNDAIYKTKGGKWNAVVNEVEARNGRPAGPDRDDLGRDLRDALGEFKRGHRPRRAEREAGVRGEGGRDDLPGGPQRRGHDRHEHGGPRRRHQARRQPRGMARPSLSSSGINPGDEGYEEKLAARVAELDTQTAPRPTPCASSAGSTSSAPSATSPGASTTSSEDGRAARVTPASPASSSRPRTT